MSASSKPIAFAKTARGEYYAANRSRARHLFTVYFKQPGMGRGEYGDEIDVWADTSTQAKRISLAVIAAEYEPDCVPSRTRVIRMNEYWTAPKRAFAVGDRIMYRVGDGEEREGRVQGLPLFEGATVPVLLEGQTTVFGANQSCLRHF